jgi:hypothetical protein
VNEINEPMFEPFPKIARLTRLCTITEKIDGTNSCIEITEDGRFLTASRTRWIYPEKTKDNYGFSQWAHENKEELMKLGVGKHFGEWWGQGVQRGYGLSEKRFSLFNTSRWSDDLVRPKCCSVVPVLYEGMFDTFLINGLIQTMREQGSIASPGFMRPEGIIVYHHAANLYFKKTLERDEEWKGKQRNA